MKEKIYKKIIGDIEPYQGIIYLVCCIGVEYDYDLITHTIKYYKKLGVDRFLFILNTEDENSEKLKYVQNILREYNIKEETIWIGEWCERIKIERMNQVVADNTSLEDWVVVIDVDEFQKYYIDLRKLISHCEKMNYNYAMGEFVDRLTENGKIVDINEDTNIWETFPVKTNLRCWNKTMYTKVLLKRASVEVYMGHHYPLNTKKYECFPSNLEVHHFKWRGSILSKLEYRIEMCKKYGLWKGGGDKKVIKRYRERGTFR